MAIMLGFPVADDWLAAGLPQEMYNSENLSGFRYQYTLSNSALKRSGLSSDGRALAYRARYRRVPIHGAPI